MKRMAWYLGACPVCGGDMHDDVEDEGWITCLLCARAFEAEAMSDEVEPHRAVGTLVLRPVTPAVPEPVRDPVMRRVA